ncbi:steroid 5 alpha-reductase [Colletotrichum sojae]|uniref:Steroid 5 alpha-reductase n=1 Tax=Colletotrichum sojae TaxID=2175907 RepID=A0A8H6MRN7_9PEZI|nr:steroid 5 alpha-reductase [Colletotrichum sojae]
MAIIEGWLPPSRENYTLISTVFQIAYPIIGSMQYLVSWYGMGKTSVASRFNIPGRAAWFLMEVPGLLTVLYVMGTLPARVGIEDLPWQNKVLAGLFVIHYVYRAVIYPFIQPSMSPIHPLVAASALGFQLCNGVSIGGWLAAYGPTTPEAWEARLYPFGLVQFVAGIGLFYVGLVGNYFHDEELREIRRAETRRQEKVRREGSMQEAKGVDKHYRLPNTMMFRYVLFPHYFLEWVEWFGWWMASGWGVPGRAFLVNEVTAMFPRAWRGRGWYEERFGEEKIRRRWTIVPGVF